MGNGGDARGIGKGRTLLVLLVIVAVFFVGIILRRALWS
jgi:hypothetical protein